LCSRDHLANRVHPKIDFCDEPTPGKITKTVRYHVFASEIVLDRLDGLARILINIIENFSIERGKLHLAWH
jgi:hypothetical protein